MVLNDSQISNSFRSDNNKIVQKQLQQWWIDPFSLKTGLASLLCRLRSQRHKFVNHNIRIFSHPPYEENWLSLTSLLPRGLHICLTLCVVWVLPCSFRPQRSGSPIKLLLNPWYATPTLVLRIQHLENLSKVLIPATTVDKGDWSHMEEGTHCYKQQKQPSWPWGTLKSALKERETYKVNEPISLML